MRRGENGTEVWANGLPGLSPQSADVPKIPDPGLDIVWGISPAHTPFSATCLAPHRCGFLLPGDPASPWLPGSGQTPDPEDVNQSLFSWTWEFELEKTLGTLAVGPGLP